MNEYNFDYLGIPGMIPNNTMNFMGNMPQNSFNPNYSNNYDNSILDPTMGFIRGNMFDKLYDSYKDYKPANINPRNEKEAMLWSFLQYGFALHDLGLYLDIYPNDNKAINLYKQYLDIYNDIKNEYEKKYGPLTCNSMYVIGNDWKWDNSPWPWEVK